MKVLLVDDHAVVREGVAAVLRQAALNSVILQAADTTAAIAVAHEHSDIDIVLLDLMMPGVSGMAALDGFAAAHPAIPVIVLSSSEVPGDVRAVLARGALGYVPKSANPATLLAAVQLVLSGEMYVPPFLANLTTDDVPPADRLAGLTDRQMAVLKLVGEGAVNKEIAYRLGISEKTVKAHLTAIFRAIKVTNRAAAARLLPSR